MNKVVDLFCGCGGFSLGFEKAGFDIVASFDNWKPAIDTYKANLRHSTYKMDLLTDECIPLIKEIKPDIIIGGPPCQDFSIAGKREQGHRANLTRRFAQILSTIRPKIFVMENVYNLEKMPILVEVTEILEDAGYSIFKKVLDSSLCGCPQKRNRFIMIGYLINPKSNIESTILKNYSKKALSVREYCGDLIDTEFYYMHPRSYSRRAIFSIDEPSATIRGVNRPMPSSYSFHKADKCKDKNKIRCLLSKERSYIQTFPVGYEFIGTKSQVEQMIGNAVPVNLAYFIAKVIKECFL